FKANARSDRQPGDWHAPTTSSEGWEVADGVAHQSEELAGLPVLRPLRQGVSPRRLGVGLCPLPEKWWRARGRRPKLRRHREVGRDQWLDELADELRNGTYQPRLVR